MQKNVSKGNVIKIKNKSNLYTKKNFDRQLKYNHYDHISNIHIVFIYLSIMIF